MLYLDIIGIGQVYRSLLQSLSPAMLRLIQKWNFLIHMMLSSVFFLQPPRTRTHHLLAVVQFLQRPLFRVDQSRSTSRQTGHDPAQEVVNLGGRSGE